MNKPVVKLKRGKTHNFRSFEDMIAFSNGEITMEEAERRFRENPPPVLKGTFTVTAISEKGVVINVK